MFCPTKSVHLQHSYKVYIMRKNMVQSFVKKKMHSSGEKIE